MLSFALTSCKNNENELVVITMWHVYGGQTDSPLNNLIDEFNSTVGAEQGIFVRVDAVSNSNNIHKGILSSVNNEPGAGKLPDIFASYPKTILAMPDDNILVDYNDYFTDDELSAFVPAFLDEGKIGDRLLGLPVAKSTEIMFVNQTAFDRFSAETGVKVSDMYTWDGLFDVSKQYTNWSDSKTPETLNDGKSLLAHDYHFNYFQVGVESLNENFFTENSLNFSKTFGNVWQPYADAVLNGGVWLKGGYATEPLRTGDAIVSVASSASVLYYSNKVTYPDNTTETVEFTAHPVPTFENGEPLVMQRGVGMYTVKSTPEKEKAAVAFLKWLTEPEINTKFVTKAGYMPVTSESFDKYLAPAVETIDNPMYKELYKAFIKTQENYTFYNAPLHPNYLDLEMRFEEQIRYHFEAEKLNYLSTEGNISDEIISDSLDKFKKNYEN